MSDRTDIPSPRSIDCGRARVIAGMRKLRMKRRADDAKKRAHRTLIHIDEINGHECGTYPGYYLDHDLDCIREVSNLADEIRWITANSGDSDYYDKAAESLAETRLHFQLQVEIHAERERMFASMIRHLKRIAHLNRRSYEAARKATMTAPHGTCDLSDVGAAADLESNDPIDARTFWTCV